MSQYPQHSPPPHLQQPPQQYGMAPYGMVGAGPPQNFYAAAGRPVAEQAPVQGPAPPVYGAMAVTPLPYGWEERFDAATGKLFYLDHINQTTSWTRPQPSMATAPPQSMGVPPGMYPPMASASMMPTSPGNNNSSPLLMTAVPHAAPAMTGPPGMGTVAAAVPATGAAVVAPVAAPPTRLSLMEPLWDQKQTAVGCSSCGKEFTFLNRRHRCRCCMRELCGTCSAKSAPVPQFNHMAPVRVCDACHSHLTGNRSRCISRCVPYFERDSTTEVRRAEALKEVHEMLTAGVEIMEESRTIGLMGPLMHVACSGSAAQSTTMALTILALLTELDETNCPRLAAVPEAVPKLVAALQAPGTAAAARVLVAQILSALSRTPALASQVVAAGYVGPLNAVLSGQYADAKLVDVMAETAALLVAQDPALLGQLSLTDMLNTLNTASPAAQRALIELVGRVPPAEVLRAANGLRVLVPLLRTMRDAVLPLLRKCAELPDAPAQLVRAGLLKELDPGASAEQDPLLLVLGLFDKEPLARALFAHVCDFPNVGDALLERKQLGRLTALLGDHHSDEHKVCALNVMAVLMATHAEHMADQMVASGALYDLINHMSLMGTSAHLRSAQLSLLHSVLKSDATALSKAPDYGAIQALLPMVIGAAAASTTSQSKTLALMSLTLICSHQKAARALLLALAGASALVRLVSENMEALDLIRVLLEDPSDDALRKELMEAGIFAVLMNIVGSRSAQPEVRTQAGLCLTYCMQSQISVDERYLDSVSYLLRSDLAIGLQLLAAFSGQPVYRAAILARHLLSLLRPALVDGSPSRRDAISTLANVSYEEEGAVALLSEGLLADVIGLSAAAGEEQAQGLSVLCVGNVAQFAMPRQAAVMAGAVESVMSAFAASTSSIVNHYCMWALRMLVVEPGAAQRIGSGHLDMAKLADQCAAKDEHALAFCAAYMPWAVKESLADAQRMEQLCARFPPPLIAVHLVALLPQSAPAVLMLCQKPQAYAAVDEAGGVARLGRSLEMAQACEALVILGTCRGHLNDLSLDAANTEALIKWYQNGAQANEAALVLVSRADTARLLALGPVLFDRLCASIGAKHALALMARLVPSKEFRAHLLSHPSALAALVARMPPTPESAEVLWRCCFEPSFVAPAGLDQFVARCVALKDDLVALRGLEMARELRLPVDASFSNPLLARLAQLQLN